jgi:hypothetical protein
MTWLEGDHMTALDRIIPTPRLIEIDRVDLGASPDRVWDLIRHGDLARSPFIRALFAVRTLPSRLTGHEKEPGTVRIDILEPRWSWTHGIDIAVSAGNVWPWVAQLGANRGGFYSYQWLENLAGCSLHNAEAIWVCPWIDGCCSVSKERAEHAVLTELPLRNLAISPRVGG